MSENIPPGRSVYQAHANRLGSHVSAIPIGANGPIWQELRQLKIIRFIYCGVERLQNVRESRDRRRRPDHRPDRQRQGWSFADDVHKPPSTMTTSRDNMWSVSYDILIVGAGIAGSALAHALSAAAAQRSRPLRICLLERSLAEPDRIVGELLQPGGIMALKNLGLESCVEGIDAIPTYGYCILLDGKPVHIPYPEGYEGRAFHHGRFIQALRAKAKEAVSVEVVEATVSELIECPLSGRVLGVRATRKEENAVEKEAFFGDLTIIADGCFSNFRSQVMGKAALPLDVKGHFVGLVLEDAELPIPKHGTVALMEDGLALLYQIGTHDTRILVDVKNPVPSDLKNYILTKVVPTLPASLHLPAQKAIEKERLRRMPNSFLPPSEQGKVTKEGVILLGDSWNMRHPLTGGGMMVAFNDVALLRDMLLDVKDLADWKEISHLLHKWHWARKPLASTVNILSVALYDLFSAHGTSSVSSTQP